MNKTAVNKFLNQSTTFYYKQSNWPSSLVSQHVQLEIEIEAIKSLLNQGGSSFIHIETRLRKLTKGLLLHLELESCFLAPILDESDLLPSQKGALMQGYSVLANTCYAISDYFQALKLECGTALLGAKQSQHISEFLMEIKNRLRDESTLYVPVKRNLVAKDEI